MKTKTTPAPSRKPAAEKAGDTQAVKAVPKPKTLTESRNSDAISTVKVGGNQVVVLRPGKTHTLSVKDEDGWKHAVAVLQGQVKWGKATWAPGARFMVSAGQGDQVFIAGKGDLVVLSLSPAISPGGSVQTKPIES